MFILVTDHKPLTTILHPGKSIPPLAASRIQCWATILSTYNYQIEFRQTQYHGNADGLSRLPLSGQLGGEESIKAVQATCFHVGQMNALPVTASQIEAETRKDIVLSQVLRFTINGWPGKEKLQQSLQPYWTRQQELTLEGSCLLWGTRVVVPKKFRERVLLELHREHTGMFRMKAIARSYFWWPTLDKDIEAMVRACVSCQSVKGAPQKAPLHPWIWPTKPWQCIHIDFAGPFQGKMFFLLVDAHSKWPEIYEMTSTTSARTIELLRHLFAAYGLPEQVVSDNGPQFISGEFESFMKNNGIKHIRTAPYHPASNGAVERLVQTFKQGLKAMGNNGLTSQHNLDNFLITYRSTPHRTTGETPSKLFLGRQFRTRFSLMVPDIGNHVRDRQATQKQHHDARSRSREFQLGSKVTVKDSCNPSRWLPGVVLKQRGPLSYLIRLDTGQVWRKHVDHIKQIDVDIPEDSSEIVHPPSMNSAPVPHTTCALDRSSTTQNVSEESVEASIPPETRRYPVRQRKPVDKLIYYQ